MYEQLDTQHQMNALVTILRGRGADEKLIAAFIRLFEAGKIGKAIRAHSGKIKLCLAKTRGEGRPPCIALALPNGRCRFHGGRSTGARTPEGLERCRQASLRGWARKRAQDILA